MSGPVVRSCIRAPREPASCAAGHNLGKILSLSGHQEHNLPIDNKVTSGA